MREKHERWRHVRGRLHWEREVKGWTHAGLLLKFYDLMKNYPLMMKLQYSFCEFQLLEDT